MPMKWSNSPGECSGCKPGAATEIDGTLEEGGFADGRAGGQHGLEQKRGSAIAEIVDQRPLKLRRVLIEQRAHIGRWHRRQFLGAEQHQPQARAMPIVGVGAPGFPERLDRLIVFAELLADFPEREPGGGKTWRKLGGLRQQIGGGGKIAFQPQIAGKIEPPVGNQIAGGQE